MANYQKKADVPIDTIRYYEKVGVLDHIQRSENNYRIYTDQTLADLLFIKHCRELDISLSDIKTLKEMKAQPKQACTEIDNLVNKYLIGVSQKIERLLLFKRNTHRFKTTLLDRPYSRRMRHFKRAAKQPLTQPRKPIKKHHSCDAFFIIKGRYVHLAELQ